MSKSKKHITCPHCNGKFQPNKISKVTKRESGDFFDIENHDPNGIEKILKQKNIEFGVISNRKEDD